MAKPQDATPAHVTPATEGLEPTDARIVLDGKEIELVDEVVLDGDKPGGPGTQPTEEKTGGEGDGTTDRPVGDPKDRNLTAALREERAKRRDILSKYDTERRLREDAEAQARNAEERARQEKERADRLAKIDEVDDLGKAVPLIRDEVAQEVEGRVRPVVDRALIISIRNSQNAAAGKHTDYFELLEKSGVEAAITIDPKTGRPADPDMYRLIFMQSDDPGEDAYRLARQILDRKEGRKPEESLAEENVDVLDEKAGDRAQGRREVIDRLDKAAERPRSIGNLPSSGGSGPTKLTRRQIDNMSDAQRRNLPEHVIEWWLSGSEVVQR